MPTSQLEGLVLRVSSDASARGSVAGCVTFTASAAVAAARARLKRGPTRVSAGVAQLVERQPSKLNVASSSLVSRSLYQFLVGAPTHEDLCQKPHAFLVGAPTHEDSGPRPSSPPSLWGFGFSDCGRSSPSCFLTRGRSRPRVRPAHLAQLVEHVLGKDEVISSILMVGSQSGCGVSPLKLRTSCAGGILPKRRA